MVWDASMTAGMMGVNAHADATPYNMQGPHVAFAIYWSRAASLAEMSLPALDSKSLYQVGLLT